MHHPVMNGAMQTSQRLLELDKVHLQSLVKRRHFEEDSQQNLKPILQYTLDRIQYCQQKGNYLEEGSAGQNIQCWIVAGRKLPVVRSRYSMER